MALLLGRQGQPSISGQSDTTITLLIWSNSPGTEQIDVNHANLSNSRKEARYQLCCVCRRDLDLDKGRLRARQTACSPTQWIRVMLKGRF